MHSLQHNTSTRMACSISKRGAFFRDFYTIKFGKILWKITLNLNSKLGSREATVIDR